MHCCSVVINRYASQQYENKDRFEVRACTASLPHIKKKNSFHKLIHVIRIFMLKIFVIQCCPRNNFNIKLFPNYCSYLC